VSVGGIGLEPAELELSLRPSPALTNDLNPHMRGHAQDALACGKSPGELHAEGVAAELIPHRTFEGNRPSLSLLMDAVNPYSVGALLALYEHRVAVQVTLPAYLSEIRGVSLAPSRGCDTRPSTFLNATR
jgi:hypothetical protein